MVPFQGQFRVLHLSLLQVPQSRTYPSIIRLLQDKLPTRNPRRVIAVVPSPVSAELLIQFPNPGASVQPAPPRPANQRPVARAAATTRISRSRVAAGEATPPPGLLSPTTRRNRRQAAAQAAAKPSGVSKKKPATKGKGRKK